MLTWLPKTPMEQADDTWPGGNHTAANLAGTLKINTCEQATMVWPKNDTQNLSGCTESTLIQAPPQVPKAAAIVATRSPCKNQRHVETTLRGRP